MALAVQYVEKKKQNDRICYKTNYHNSFVVMRIHFQSSLTERLGEKDVDKIEQMISCINHILKHDLSCHIQKAMNDFVLFNQNISVDLFL